MADDEIAHLRAEADRFLAEAERMQAEAQRRRIARTAQCDQTMALARDALARAGKRPPAARRGPRSRAAWTTADIIAALEAEAPLPISTPRLVDKLCLQHEYATVLRLLNGLAKRGEVEKWPAGESRCCYWRRLNGLAP